MTSEIKSPKHVHKRDQEGYTLRQVHIQVERAARVATRELKEHRGQRRRTTDSAVPDRILGHDRGKDG